jgi:hypothetical protein
MEIDRESPSMPHRRNEGQNYYNKVVNKSFKSVANSNIILRN